MSSIWIPVSASFLSPLDFEVLNNGFLVIEEPHGSLISAKQGWQPIHAYKKVIGCNSLIPVTWEWRKHFLRWLMSVGSGYTSDLKTTEGGSMRGEASCLLQDSWKNALSHIQLKLQPGFPYLPPECKLPSWLLGLFSPEQTPHLYPMVSTQQNTSQLHTPKALLPQPA